MYGVMFVQDPELPKREWAFARWDGRLFLFLRESAVCPRVLEEAWVAYREMVSAPKAPRLPGQRQPETRVKLKG